MVPAYLLTIDITERNGNLCETEFQERLAPCIAYLDALNGAFEKKPCNTFFYPPDPQIGNSIKQSARCVVMISVGKVRAGYLLDLYQAIVKLIGFELPDFEVRAEISEYKFS